MRMVVVVPMWNHSEFTDRIIEYLNKQTLSTFDLIVVDDGSSTPYVLPEFIKGKSEIIRHDTNLGCGPAWNSGAVRAIESSDLVCIINNDLKISDNLLESFIKFYKNPPPELEADDIGVMCPSTGNNITGPGAWGYGPSKIPEGDWMYDIHGLCFCSPTRILKKKYEIEGYCYDPGYSGGDYEDIDMGMWMIKYNYESVVLRESYVWDNCSATSSVANKPNKPYFLSKWGSEEFVNTVWVELYNGIKGRPIFKNSIAINKSADSIPFVLKKG